MSSDQIETAKILITISESLGEIKSQLVTLNHYMETNNTYMSNLDLRVGKLEHAQSRMKGIIIAATTVIGFLGAFANDIIEAIKHAIKGVN